MLHVPGPSCISLSEPHRESVVALVTCRGCSFLPVSPHWCRTWGLPGRSPAAREYTRALGVFSDRLLWGGGQVDVSWVGVDGPAPYPEGGPSAPTAEWQVAEARALVHTLAGWSVVDTMVVPTKTPERRLIFGKGNFEHLTGESLWVCPSSVSAKSMQAESCKGWLPGAREAAGQVSGRRGQPRRRMSPQACAWGSDRSQVGESFLQLRQRLLREKEVKLRRALERLRRKSFLSQLPHGLIESFSATLEDVAHADVIVHVRDVSHPETELQKVSVLSALQGLGLPAPLLDSVVEVHNKVDLVPGYRPPDPSAVAVSALRGQGLEELRVGLEEAVLRATGRQVLTLHIQLAGPQLSWLYKEATVQQVDVLPEAGAAHVKVIISNSAYGKFRKLFPG
uniref:putative GTP-binding protein 6 n=1 Tax=Ictidomys tridecemlineatus TaxID=43179 RepID=UPI000B539FFA|nr:putative GTP-binding protein 6 [Ictidomys tridecemlineatus]